MLRSLTIRDYALIEELAIDFDSGLNILTGETGAGKSIIVGALKMILGERASTDTVRSGARKAVIEGIFDEYDTEAVDGVLIEAGIDRLPQLILRREISEAQSRAFINDSPATIAVLKAVAEELVDLHGQHEHQSLLRPQTHVVLLDAAGGLGDLRKAYGSAFEAVAALMHERDELAARERDMAREKERWEFQIAEIDQVGPETGEEDRLEAERRVLENAERLHESTATLFDLLYESEGAVHDRLTLARNELADLARIDPHFDEALVEMSAARIAVDDIAKVLQDYNARIEFNPERLEEIRDRLGALERLKRRYGGSLDAVIAHRADIGAQFDIAADFEGVLGRMDVRIRQARAVLSEAADRLSQKRHETAARIEDAVVRELAGLGMQDALFVVDFETRADPEGWVTAADGTRFSAFPDGTERINFLLSTNRGESPRPLARIASGGEVSRVMLALKTILAKRDRLPILVFDEIDVGVSGAVAQRVGERLRDLAGFHQIVAITHLPQVAAHADTHFRVEKHPVGDRTVTSVARLSDTERTEEIAALMSGSEVTDAARRSARELIGGAHP